MSADLLREYKEATDNFIAAAKAVSETKLYKAPANDEWSPANIIHHLADTEAHFYIRYLKILTEDVPVTDFFDENGGIYNVTFSLRKSSVSYEYQPDDETFLSVFIANVRDFTTNYYPPENNIVKIGNNIASLNVPPIILGDTTVFSVNLIQYGYPAQLCFEPSGSRVDETYFGIIIDDISICKIGKTTDPRFIAPLTVGGVIAQNETQNPGAIITE